VSALGLLIFGFSSVLLGGIIGDKYAPKNHQTYAHICMYGALATIPLIALGTIYNQNFWLSAILSFLSILFSGSYFSPTITMMQNSTDRDNSGNVVSIYTFVTAIAQTIAPLIFNILANFYGAQ
jgi:MFS family permease